MHGRSPVSFGLYEFRRTNKAKDMVEKYNLLPYLCEMLQYHKKRHTEVFKGISYVVESMGSYGRNCSFGIDRTSDYVFSSGPTNLFMVFGKSYFIWPDFRCFAADA